MASWGSGADLSPFTGVARRLSVGDEGSMAAEWMATVEGWSRNTVHTLDLDYCHGRLK